MTIEEKYLELRKKSVNRKNNRYLFTYLENRPKSRLYIALFKRRNKPQNVLNISRHSSNNYGLRYAVHLTKLCMPHEKS